jgi:hypothetical protein
MSDWNRYAVAAAGPRGSMRRTTRRNGTDRHVVSAMATSSRLVTW